MSIASPRLRALSQLAQGYRQPAPQPKDKSVFESFGQDVFNLRLMRERLPKDVYKRIKSIGLGENKLSPHDADVVASSMKDWAISRGATHYTHWFQPMTGMTAEKHDAFLAPLPDGQVISEFSGRLLIKGESDASSFPSGGLRSTFEARGYTAWDPTSPAFLLRRGTTVTLCIPTVFYSYTGESLDRKTPLLRSLSALSRQAVRMMKLLGYDNCISVSAQVGAEQEYFLIDRRLYLFRPDLLMCGRTLFGARPAKGQQMGDHYYASVPQRVLAYMEDVDARLFALGVPVHTRHNESAPCQYELAPIYEPTNVAIDHNMLIMEVLSRTAEDHDLACLLHEKPFNGVNGSGKHNNWSLVDNNGRNLLDPGPDPWNNVPFLIILAAIMRSIHLYGAVWRIGTVGLGNDYRLGSSEAPPAIISAYIGKDLEQIVDNIIEGCTTEETCRPRGEEVDLGLNGLPSYAIDSADRNRTSPMAFTGNKFEFRALGGSQSVATINIAINTTVAQALSDISDAIEKTVKDTGKSGAAAAMSVLPDFFKEHRVAIFNGDNYSAEWVQEASRRGLPNLKDSVESLAQYDRPEIIEVFAKQGVLSKTELLSRQLILLNDYINRILIEADLTLNLGRKEIKPVAVAWQNKLAAAAKDARELLGDDGYEMEAYKNIVALTRNLEDALKGLDNSVAKVKAFDEAGGLMKKAESARDLLLPAMRRVRFYADQLECVTDASMWPMPTYADIFWSL